jgi:hypothetical protein
MLPGQAPKPVVRTGEPAAGGASDTQAALLDYLLGDGS